MRCGKWVRRSSARFRRACYVRNRGWYGVEVFDDRAYRGEFQLLPVDRERPFSVWERKPLSIDSSGAWGLIGHARTLAEGERIAERTMSEISGWHEKGWR